ncbi:hypothetical protein A3197_01465 [Candidatus Thiodiazotropha endoloripes]|nr:hypothetical protein A3197_01465 [Candidatus Thiodiazotropha endoloripes]
MNMQIDLLELHKVPGISFSVLPQLACNLQLCVDMAAIEDAAGRIIAAGLLSAHDSSRYPFNVNDLELLSDKAAEAILDVFLLKRRGAEIQRLIVDGSDFLIALSCRLFPEKQVIPSHTVSLHPEITHRQLLVMLNAIDCEMTRTDGNHYVIAPRAVHTNANVVKFPHRRGQFGATHPATPE